MKKVSFADMHCSLARSLDAIGDWWTPLIVRDLYLGIGKFDDLIKDLGISRNLLTERLKRLVETGVVERRADTDRPSRQRYALTEKGMDLMPAIFALIAWGDRWVAPKAGPPMVFRHTTCGKMSRAAVCCSECGEALSPYQVDIYPGPGGAFAPGTMVVAERLVEKANKSGGASERSGPTVPASSRRPQE